ncbi:unnamed protein product [Rotaria sp. Silwood2]|nr:unnamed protein product [Rotaria sp. Silwood2]
MNVTSHDVLLWSSSIDLAERYQYYIDQPTKSNRLNEHFFNCTLPWFGSHCQYSFKLPLNLTESSLNMQWKSHQTCYILLECDRGAGSICLDWREICNGRIDCFNDGVDESQCFELEINECNENKRRCHNGLCIPKWFWNGEFDEAECLDKSDLLVMSGCPNTYLKLHIFACAEYTCRPDEGQFPCGDGQCVEDFGQCRNGRHRLLIESLSAQGNLPYDCWIAMVCLSKIIDQVDEVSCEQLVNHSEILRRLETCEYPVQFPVIPVLLGHVRFLYDTKEIFNISSQLALLPDYICYDEELCDFLTPTFHHGNLTCRYGYEMGLEPDFEVNDWKSIVDLVKPHFHGCITRHYHNIRSSDVSLYACKNSSKYISKHRLFDGISDCFLNDDEQISEWSCSLNEPYRFQCLDDVQCPSISLLKNVCQSERHKTFDQILFYEICNRVTDVSPMIINDRVHSDETDCENWPCNNVYTRCDGFWSCTDENDEKNCTRPLCPEQFLPCISTHNSTLICLPANQVGNGIIDCLGASDELEYCRQKYINEQTYRFYCQNDTTCIEHYQLCDGVEDCLLGDDEKFCGNRSQLCEQTNLDDLTDIEYILCRIVSIHRYFFSLQTALTYPLWPTVRIDLVDDSPSDERYEKSSFDDSARSGFCNYGLYVYHRLSFDNISGICFCPPNYYGDRCQYQNQRVSLTVVLGFLQYRTIYAIVITLFEDDDNRQKIHSYHHLTQVPKFWCGRPHNIYLLYSIRPKDNSKKYNIRVDAFDKTSLIYLASWYFKIPFVFLPVNRLAIFLTLPAYRASHFGPCPVRCYKGICTKYLNEERFFCRCYPGWSGAQCHISIDYSYCSSNSVCVGSIHNRSICVCPIDKFGSRCLLQQACPKDFCQNNGQCVLVDDRMIDDSYVCICPEQFGGIRCQEVKSKIEISFQNIEIPSYLFAYIYSDIDNIQPTLTFVILHKVKMFQNIITLYSMLWFYLVILRIDINYYLAVVQQTPLVNVSTTITPAQRCVPFQELFNSELLKLPRIHRLKSYHIPCQKNIDLQCFTDESYICLCTVERHSNCFLFDFNMTIACQDDVYCENGGKCLQDRATCPESVLCVCADCFFGDRCQFYAKGIGLTLDDMLRYVIRPNISYNDQSIIIKLSAALTMIIFVTGLINSLLAYSVFHQPNTHTVGSGMYLHILSIVSGLVVSILTIKFWFVVHTHINQSIHRCILHGGCVLLEIALKFFLHMSNWLNACVAIERMFTVYKGIHFDKNYSKYIARWTIRFLPFIILSPLSHEFIYRGLFDDHEEQRIWCVFRYSQSIEQYSRTIQLFHFTVPFSINLFSALFIIYNMARRRAITQIRQNNEHQFLEQLNEHKQLIISPIVLVILSLPRLIISLLSGCIKVSRNPWLYLSGYFISFLPSTFVCVIFVLPSTFYKKQCQELIISWQRRIFCCRTFSSNK